MECASSSGVSSKAAVLTGTGGEAEGASFREVSRKRDDPKHAPTKRSSVQIPRENLLKSLIGFRHEGSYDTDI